MNFCSFLFLLLAGCIEAQESQVGDVRLVPTPASDSYTGGRLEIYIHREWGTVCDNGFGPTEADVACRQLGYAEASSYGNNLGYETGLSSRPIWLDQVNCLDTNSRIIDCSYIEPSDDCYHSQDVVITCRAFEYGALRLVQDDVTSPSLTAGRLEIFIGDEWGTICDSQEVYFGSNEADVACTQLGFVRAEDYGSDLGYGFGLSSQHIWLEYVVCSGFERKIIDCLHSKHYDSDDCSHSNDVMIKCTPTRISTLGAVIGCIIGVLLIAAIIGVCGCRYRVKASRRYRRLQNPVSAPVLNTVPPAAPWCDIADPVVQQPYQPLQEPYPMQTPTQQSCPTDQLSGITAPYPATDHDPPVGYPVHVEQC